MHESQLTLIPAFIAAAAFLWPLVIIRFGTLGPICDSICASGKLYADGDGALTEDIDGAGDGYSRWPLSTDP